MNKLIVVSGGTRGIGKAIIEKFAKEGFDIATCSRNANELEALKLAIESEFSTQKVHIFQADLSDKVQTKAFAIFVLELEQNIEVLVNNTGVFIPSSLLSEDDGTLEQQINTNLYSAYYLSKALLPNMIERKNGYLVNICSVASIEPHLASGSYTVSKFAMLGLSKALRQELKPHNIKVTAILPGAVLTSAWDGLSVDTTQFITPADIAALLWTCHQLSPAAVVEEILMRPM